MMINSMMALMMVMTSDIMNEKKYLLEERDYRLSRMLIVRHMPMRISAIPKIRNFLMTFTFTSKPMFYHFI